MSVSQLLQQALLSTSLVLVPYLREVCMHVVIQCCLLCLESVPLSLFMVSDVSDIGQQPHSMAPSATIKEREGSINFVNVVHVWLGTISRRTVFPCCRDPCLGNCCYCCCCRYYQRCQLKACDLLSSRGIFLFLLRHAFHLWVSFCVRPYSRERLWSPLAAVHRSWI